MAVEHFTLFPFEARFGARQSGPHRGRQRRALRRVRALSPATLEQYLGEAVPQSPEGGAHHHPRIHLVLESAVRRLEAQAPAHVRGTRRQSRVALHRQLLLRVLRARAENARTARLALRRLPSSLESAPRRLAARADALRRSEDLPRRALDEARSDQHGGIDRESRALSRSYLRRIRGADAGRSQSPRRHDEIRPQKSRRGFAAAGDSLPDENGLSDAAPPLVDGASSRRAVRGPAREGRARPVVFRPACTRRALRSSYARSRGRDGPDLASA